MVFKNPYGVFGAIPHPGMAHYQLDIWAEEKDKECRKSLYLFFSALPGAKLSIMDIFV